MSMFMILSSFSGQIWEVILVNFLFPSPQFWALTPPNLLVSSNDADPPKRELLAWHRCRNPTFWLVFDGIPTVFGGIPTIFRQYLTVF